MSKVIANKPNLPNQEQTNTAQKHWLNRLKGWGKELAIFAVIFFGITAWQTKDMLGTDGSVEIAAAVTMTVLKLCKRLLKSKNYLCPFY